MCIYIYIHTAHTVLIFQFSTIHIIHIEVTLVDTTCSLLASQIQWLTDLLLFPQNTGPCEGLSNLLLFHATGLKRKVLGGPIYHVYHL